MNGLRAMLSRGGSKESFMFTILHLYGKQQMSLVGNVLKTI